MAFILALASVFSMHLLNSSTNPLQILHRCVLAHGLPYGGNLGKVVGMLGLRRTNISHRTDVTLESRLLHITKLFKAKLCRKDPARGVEKSAMVDFRDKGVA